MSETPMVSVLMTAYNREKYIAEAIESVIGSTYTNFELIIVDDYSIDKTVSIVKSYLYKDDRVKLFINEKNLGDYPNRNKAASYARGKYLKYLDSDDLICSHGLEVFVSAMEKFPQAAFGLMSKKLQKDKPYPICLSPEEAYLSHFFVDGIFHMGPSASIIKRGAFEAIGGFSGKRMIGDTELWINLALYYSMVDVHPSLIFWREHEGQEIKFGLAEGLYLNMDLPMIISSLNKENVPLSQTDKNNIIVYNKKVVARSILSAAVKEFSFKKYWDLKNVLGLRIMDFVNAIFFLRRKLKPVRK